MAPLHDVAADLRAALVGAQDLRGQQIPNQQLIRMTIRRLVFKKILNPETIVNEIAKLPGLEGNAQGAVLSAIETSIQYENFKGHLKRLESWISVAELFSEIFNLTVLGGFGISMIVIVSWGVGITRLLCILPWVFRLLTRYRWRRDFHVLVIAWIIFLISFGFFGWMIFTMVDHKNKSNEKFFQFCTQALTSLTNGTQKLIIHNLCQEMRDMKLSSSAENIALADGICQVFLTLFYV